MTAPWLAPDGMEWGVRRLTRLPVVRWSSGFHAHPRKYPARRTPVSRAIRFLVAEINAAGPSARAALWELFSK